MTCGYILEQIKLDQRFLILDQNYATETVDHGQKNWTSFKADQRSIKINEPEAPCMVKGS